MSLCPLPLSEGFLPPAWGQGPGSGEVSKGWDSQEFKLVELGVGRAGGAGEWPVVKAWATWCFGEGGDRHRPAEQEMPKGLQEEA